MENGILDQGLALAVPKQFRSADKCVVCRTMDVGYGVVVVAAGRGEKL